MINQAVERVPFSLAATGTYDIPTNITFATSADYDVVIEKGGIMNPVPANKTATSFDVIADGADAVTGYIVSNIPMASSTVA